MIKRAILFLFLMSGYHFIAAQVSYDQSQVTSDTVVDFAVTKYRGIRTVEGMVHYLGRDHQTLTSYSKNKILWQVNVINSCTPEISNAEIRYQYLTDGALKLDFGNKAHRTYPSTREQSVATRRPWMIDDFRMFTA